MELLRIAGATLNQIPMDWDGNTARIVGLLEEARDKKVAALCFPELAISGYNCEDMFLSLHVARRATECLLEIRPHTKDIAAIIGLPVYYQGAMFNCVAVLQNQKILGIIPKKVLPREGVHYEPRWFQVWSFGEADTIIIDGERVPFGDLRFQFGKVGLGIEICEEAWGSQGPSAQAISGTEIIMNPSASHFAMGKYGTRETLVADASRAMQVHYVYSNLVGLENGRMIYDGGVLIGECGKIAARGPRFGFQESSLLIRDVDLDIARVGKLNNRSFNLGMGTPLPLTVDGDVFPIYENIPLQKDHLADVRLPTNREEEFLQAEMLALFDYLRKTKSQGYVVSLSGGCDSSACVTLIAHMVAEALKELGPDRMNQYFKKDIKSQDPKVWIKSLLTTVYQRTSNSGSVTFEAAQKLSEEIGSEFHHLNVQGLVDGYVDHAEAVLGRSLSWDKDDLSLQNIQARARAPMVWLLANIKGAILVSTSNRSEAAVGYATMDGDSAGGISPLTGIDKHFLRQWLRWAETECEKGLGPIASLKLVNEQQPTAELRPQDSGQTDEADLMPYAVLAQIERYFIRDRMGPDSILDKLESDFPDLTEAKLKDYLIRFLTLWSRNQWKRERYAPSFHLDDVSLDPKSWCRFPILSSGFEREIRDL
ncbi:NAD(+) synthase [Pseudobacteriovorax antillogorgiicola]|uniref:Glutamine-dependent NAD(+) synthetase n=1 Tax=Pseudobacteriovorax antillogorgiicola TaxID=1513793 RepID=A0A1Y6CAW4_9BACT|nr:NAD(+) synthase [Pseudobacteriovorax antillogorgiicola]TCS48701.1 NAD+ synthase (glutamine-hydrolysing) [Pseudobacteriovorax antillogorgiicola]SMF54715.1 NAD+ synthase (glutamine-hydrolysing) [Pseudobacteriovorax antillogorgiicola]